LQIERVNWRGTLAGCRVLVCEHGEESLSVFYGPQLLARFAGVSTTEKSAVERRGKDVHGITDDKNHMEADSSSAHTCGQVDLLTTYGGVNRTEKGTFWQKTAF
jgi:hypothetical protein